MTTLYVDGLKVIELLQEEARRITGAEGQGEITTPFSESFVAGQIVGLSYACKILRGLSGLAGE